MVWLGLFWFFYQKILCFVLVVRNIQFCYRWSAATVQRDNPRVWSSERGNQVLSFSSKINFVLEGNCWVALGVGPDSQEMWYYDKGNWLVALEVVGVATIIITDTSIRPRDRGHHHHPNQCQVTTPIPTVILAQTISTIQCFTVYIQGTYSNFSE